MPQSFRDIPKAEELLLLTLGWFLYILENIINQAQVFSSVNFCCRHGEDWEREGNVATVEPTDHFLV